MTRLSDADLLDRLRAEAPALRPLPGGFADKLRQRLAAVETPPAGRVLAMAIRRSGWIRLAAASLVLHVCAVGAVGWLVFQEAREEHVIRILPDDPVAGLLPQTAEEEPVVLAPPAPPDPEVVETSFDGLRSETHSVERFLRRARGSHRLRQAVALEPGGQGVLAALDLSLDSAGSGPLAMLARHFAEGSQLPLSPSDDDPVLWWGQWEASYAGAHSAAPGPGPVIDLDAFAAQALMAWGHRLALQSGSPAHAGTTASLETLYAVTPDDLPERKALLAACLLFAGENRPSLIREATWDPESIRGLSPVEMVVAAHALARTDRRHGVQFCRLVIGITGISAEWRAVILSAVVAYDTP